MGTGVCICVSALAGYWGASLVMNIGIGGPEGALPFSQGLGMNLGVVLLEDPVFGS